MTPGNVNKMVVFRKKPALYVLFFKRAKQNERTA
jgi:hypothetical protein